MNRKVFYLSVLLLAAVVVLAGLLTSPVVAGGETMPAAAGTEVTKIKVNGRGASVFLGDDATGQVTVAQDLSAGTTALDFSYSIPHPTDPDLAIVFQGADYIPNEAFTISSNSAHLALTTPPEFFLNRCVVSLITGEFTCESGDPITFDLTWVSNGIQRIEEKTKRTEILGPVITKFDGEFGLLSATVSGTWGDGLTAADMTGFLLDTQGKTFTREITAPNP